MMVVEEARALSSVQKGKGARAGGHDDGCLAGGLEKIVPSVVGGKRVSLCVVMCNV